MHDNLHSKHFHDTNFKKDQPFRKARVPLNRL